MLLQLKNKSSSRLQPAAGFPSIHRGQKKNTTVSIIHGDIGRDVTTLHVSQVEISSTPVKDNISADKGQVLLGDTNSCNISLYLSKPEEITAVAVIHEDIGGEVTTMHVSPNEITSTPEKRGQYCCRRKTSSARGYNQLQYFPLSIKARRNHCSDSHSQGYRWRRRTNACINWDNDHTRWGQCRHK